MKKLLMLLTVFLGLFAVSCSAPAADDDTPQSVGGQAEDADDNDDQDDD